MYNGWTPTIPEHERMENRLKTALAQLEDDPDNEYWQNVRDEADAYLHGGPEGGGGGNEFREFAELAHSPMF